MTTPERLAFGATVKALRKRRGWTQMQLAERAGLHRNAVALVELALREPSLSIITRIATALGVAPGRLFKPTAAGRPKKRKQ